MSIKAMNWAWSIKDLKPAEKLVLMKLADHANDDGLCWPGKSSIAEACNVSKRSADAHIQTLAAKGLITIHRRKSKDNDRLNDTNYYYLNLEQPELLSGADSALVQKLQYGKKGQGGSAKIDKGGANSAPEPSVNHHKNLQGAKFAQGQDQEPWFQTWRGICEYAVDHHGINDVEFSDPQQKLRELIRRLKESGQEVPDTLNHRLKQMAAA